VLQRFVILWLAIGLAACGQDDRGDKFTQKKGGGTSPQGDTKQPGGKDDAKDEDEGSTHDGGTATGGGSGGGQTQTSTSTGTGQAGDDDDDDGSTGGGVAPAVDAGEPGPLQIDSYTEGLDSSDYASAIVYYPTDSKRAKMPATTLSGGFTNTKEDMIWLAEHLASHGFVVIAFTPTTNTTLDPNVWATGHKGAIAKIKAENGRAGSPLQGKVDVGHLGISGFSMGGAGTIVAVNELGSAVQASVPICAFNPILPAAKVPTLFITGSADIVAAPGPIVNAYQSMQSGAPKALTNFTNMSHFDVYMPSAQHANIARYMTAWYQVHLMGDDSYRSYLDGEALEENKAAGVFAGNDGFQYSD
jgi:dienelactone hydrolase